MLSMMHRWDNDKSRRGGEL